MWVDVSCLPNNARPAGGMEATSAASKGQAVAEAVAFSDSELVQTEGQVRVFFLCCLRVGGVDVFVCVFFYFSAGGIDLANRLTDESTKKRQPLR